MTAVDQYNALDGKTVEREELKRIAILGSGQHQDFIFKKLTALLETYPEEESFHISIGNRAHDVVPKDCLPGMDCLPPGEEDQVWGNRYHQMRFTSILLI